MKLLVISGSMGSGKTTVMAEASDILAARGIDNEDGSVTKLANEMLARAGWL